MVQHELSVGFYFNNDAGFDYQVCAIGSHYKFLKPNFERNLPGNG